MTSRGAGTRTAMICRSCDRLVSAGIVALIGFTPLAFGAVYPWAFCLMESVIFLLVAVWMAKIVVSAAPIHLVPAAVPASLSIAILILQLVPLPPALLRMLSPTTYVVYSKTLPGWPSEIRWPGEIRSVDCPRGVSGQSTGFAILPTVDEVKRGARVPFASAIVSASVIAQKPSKRPTTDYRGVSAASSPHTTDRYTDSIWRPLSIAPSLSRTGALKLLAYAALFLLVAKYPFGDSFSAEREREFCRLLVVALLSTGIVVALTALVQFSWWNGKIFGFLVPYDWAAPRPEIRHTGGPFVDPDHLANYLAMLLPLTIAGALLETPVISGDWQMVFRLFCASGFVVMWSALMLSSSRGGWLGALGGLSLFAWLIRGQLGSKFPAYFRRFRVAAISASVAGLVVVTLVASMLIGSIGRRQVDNRLEQTLAHQTSLRERVSLWHDSLGMIREFPLLGVGLGCWPELFPYYHRPPWQSGRFLEAHNDYLQLLAETGLVGLALLAWFFFDAVSRPVATIARITPS
ncbi:MAG TPA: O-antigen ligase family protein, partial [Candidatus Binataceae bacterium]|nr:O-antigen ligase family protein [Candidatus Binataceae bacterium]